MNIFVLDRDPERAARMHADQHVGKMAIESAQLLSSVHHVLGSDHVDEVYRLTHRNHPCAIWARQSRENYRWLYALMRNLLLEFERRRDKGHKTSRMVSPLAHLPEALEGQDRTPFVQCMPDEYKDPDPVTAYRNFYLGDKSRFATWDWPNAVTPYWWEPLNSAPNRA